MKTKQFKIFLLLLMLPAIVLAGDGKKGKYTKEKKISKAYIVNGNAALDVTNKYGAVYVTTWDEDETAIDVVITVSANNEEQVNKRLNSIDVDFEGTKGLVSAQTKIGNFKGGKVSMEINYTIRIPKNGSVKVSNQYGDIMLGKINGKSEINGQYGSVNAEELNNENNNFNVQYCKNSRVGYIKSGTINASYSELNIGKAGKLTMNCEYTLLHITDVDDLTFRSDYGEITIGNVDKVAGIAKYSASKFGHVNSLLNLSVEYSEISVGQLSKNVRNVAINSTYGPVTLKYGSDYAFDFEISLEYDKLNGGSDFKFSEKKEKNNSAYYKGYHKSSGTNRVFIRSEYGEVKLIKS